MRELLWITERELRERRLVLMGAFLLGLLTLATPLLPSVRSESPIVAINVMATVLALGVSIAVAILAGGSAIGRDLAEGRLGFYFSRPLGSLSIWGGKMLGALLLAIGAALLVVLPVTFLGGGLLEGLTAHVPLQVSGGGGLVELATGALAPSFLLGFLALLMFLVSFANACSTALRARSKWILLDVVGLPLLIFFFWLSVRPLLLGGAPLLFRNSLMAIACAFVLATVVAGAVGLVQGRSDIRVVHRGLSQTLAAVLGLFVLCFAGYSIWVRSADPSDLERIWGAYPASGGTWVNVAGEAAGRADYVPGFLINVATKESLRTGGMGWAGARVTFSDDGTHAAWIKLASSSFQGPAIADVMMADLGPNPVVKRTNLTIYPSRLQAMALSPDGSRLAVVENGTLSVIQVKSEKSLVTTLLPHSQQWSLKLDFVSNDLMRVYTAVASTKARPNAVEIFELDIPTRRLSRTGGYEGVGVALSPEHDRLVTWDAQARTHRIVDSRTGVELAKHGRLAEGERGRAWLTSRGSVELISSGVSSRAELHGADGRVTRVVDLGPARDLLGGGEPAAGKMSVLRFVGPNILASDVVLIDLDSGGVRKVEGKLLPVRRSWNSTYPKPGSIATKLYEEPGKPGRLVYLDPLTGERRLITGK